MRVREPAPAAVPPREIDFTRPRVCVLGLPFDPISLPEAVERVRADAFAGRRCWIATPNLNFAIAARSDAAFRQSVLRSDLSLADGMPPVWIARALGVPMPQRVAGSDLFEALQAHPGPPSASTSSATAGRGGARRRAHQRARRRALRRFDEAGYGPSKDEQCGAHRAHQPQRRAFHLRRGRRAEGPGLVRPQRRAAGATGLAHLGAVVNFSAGTVSRAPPWRGAAAWNGLRSEEPAL
jgi:N-acetylglucosaminyldiphosphoundecaprenol N-acetyl-beta-D-mannosaminyltransferase